MEEQAADHSLEQASGEQTGEEQNQGSATDGTLIASLETLVRERKSSRGFLDKRVPDEVLAQT